MENHILTELTYMEQSMKHEIHHHLCPTCLRRWACDKTPCGHMHGVIPQPWECCLCFWDRKGAEVATPERMKQIYG